MAGQPLRRYRVKLNGFNTVMRLSESDLENYPGAEPLDETSGDAPTIKARTATTNKARTTASNKAADGGGS